MPINPVLNGAQYISTTQVSVGATPTLLAERRNSRRSILVVNVGGSSAVYLGTESITTATGSYIPAVDGASVSIPTTGRLYGVVTTGTQTVSVMEVYDAG
jgi:hypothetical protein